MMDPSIYIDSYYAKKDMTMPVTVKPLPALLAAPSIEEPSLYSSNSSLHISSSCQSLASLFTNREEDGFDSSAYYLVIQKQSQEIQELRQNIIELNERYMDQYERVQQAEQAKFQVESELEDLSLKLFEQANEMVSQEKRARYYAEKRVARLEKELASVNQELGDEREQLKELKLKFELDQDTYCHPLTIQNIPPPQQQYHQITSPLLSPAPPPPPPSQTPQTPQTPVIKVNYNKSTSIMDPANIYLDDHWLKLFKEFLVLAPNTPLDLIHRLPFLKLCLDLDIEPCLRFGNTAKSSNRLSARKALEAIMFAPCFIESELPMKRHSHDDPSMTLKQPVTTRRSSFVMNALNQFRTTTTTPEEPKHQCYGCGTALNNKDLFRFKLKEHDTDWFWIDRACRDRLVAACDFYVFIRHVRAGLQDQRSVQSLFQECVWLKLCMFWARSGVHHYIKSSYKINNMEV
ncbi:hypothetical protein BD770DRAFT_400260 [Pilaira anomala]|nr:hypothetical protein BD770DRAFT_400260 [Pilaira anomala]